jgi:DNA-binding NarL/FixJ family response regulator
VNRRSFLKGTAASIAVLATTGVAAFGSRTDPETRARRVLADPSREIEELVREGNAARPWFAPLTARQAYVSELLAVGLTNGAIAGRLGISVRTTDAHVQNIFRKLDLHRREQVSEWVVRSRPS